MILKFQCAECSNIYEAVGTRLEYHSPVYGPCAKYLSESPCCKAESDEYREPNPGRKSSVAVPASSPGCCRGEGRCGF